MEEDEQGLVEEAHPENKHQFTDQKLHFGDQKVQEIGQSTQQTDQEQADTLSILVTSGRRRGGRCKLDSFFIKSKKC